jgi:hypothetical protein
MKQEQIYICPTCKATKTIKARPGQSLVWFNQQLPQSVPCGFRGCTDRAIRKPGPKITNSEDSIKEFLKSEDSIKEFLKKAQEKSGDN